ncbi:MULTISPECIES: hypothetical protein [unclassified Aeromicrobium]|jgi:DNA gyrase subunit A|uniref:hypothetical protein n=1 Tax=unclassified Aeromicrobium TaxID=2633570 RepID=UPI000A7F8848|nr:MULTISPECIES: hypothetical protein [unclassified Aeromicrobium]
MRFLRRRPDPAEERAERLECLRDQVHILRGVEVALGRWLEVAEVVHDAPSVNAARTALEDLLQLDELQVLAVVDLQLRRSAGQERAKVAEEILRLEEELAGLTA